jgi:hypothetical protein
MGASFSDIDNHWAKACILALAERHLVCGYPDGSFQPNGPITRAEFAVLMQGVFPDAEPVRSAVGFVDVPNQYWASQVINWSYERGFFSGYPDGKFQPMQPMPRMQAVIVLSTALGLQPIATTEATLNTYFDDAAQIPDWTRWAVAAATASDRLIVNYPDVRLFRPTQNLTRGEMAAMLCRALDRINPVPPQLATWNIGIYDIRNSITVPFEHWRGSGRLMHDIQTLLLPFRLFPPGDWISGKYDWQTEQALTQFCDFYGLNAMKVGRFDQAFAEALLQADPVEFIMAQAKDRQQVFQAYLQQEAGYSADNLAFLDQGYLASACVPDIALFPDRILQIADTNAATHPPAGYIPYPALGVVPAIESDALDFLHPCIVQACVCIGTVVEGQIWTRWLGKNALTPVQLWSTTKIIPLLNLAAKANKLAPSVNLRDCLVCQPSRFDGYGFYDLAVDLVSYRSLIGSSNAVAAMFKQFFTPVELEGWLKQLTGNAALQFQGRYGEEPLLLQPRLVNQPTDQVICDAVNTDHQGNNFISTYDLTRMITLLSWHEHLPVEARIPDAKWSSLETIVRAMATDTARYLDAAIETLGLAPAIDSPVIISKMGFGRSDIRNQTELGYAAYLQFIDQRPVAQGKPGILHMISMALLGAEASGDANEEARQLDARITAEVTEIMRQIMTQELK